MSVDRHSRTHDTSGNMARWTVGRGPAGGGSERRRLGILAVCLLGFVAAVSLAMMGARPTRAASRSGSPQPGQTTSPVPVTAASRTMPPNFWTDYVQVDTPT